MQALAFGPLGTIFEASLSANGLSDFRNGDGFPKSNGEYATFPVTPTAWFISGSNHSRSPGGEYVNNCVRRSRSVVAACPWSKGMVAFLLNFSLVKTSPPYSQRRS